MDLLATEQIEMRWKWMKTWKGDAPSVYVVQSCSLELSCMRYRKEQNWRREGEWKEREATRNESDDAGGFVYGLY